ncbi:TonB-dependent receptor [Bacteroides fragilis]|nr:TonB-dependent receptor [Bacteroides fragilis]
MGRKTRTTEVGLDLSFFDNRLNANFTYYNRLTMDKYADLSLPTTTGFSSVRIMGEISVIIGIEMELSGTILKIKDWTWKMGGNISYNKNKVVTLTDNGKNQPKESYWMANKFIRTQSFR